jgi:hypothetical protein
VTKPEMVWHSCLPAVVATYSANVSETELADLPSCSPSRSVLANAVKFLER